MVYYTKGSRLFLSVSEQHCQNNVARGGAVIEKSFLEAQYRVKSLSVLFENAQDTWLLDVSSKACRSFQQPSVLVLYSDKERQVHCKHKDTLHSG